MEYKSKNGVLYYLLFICYLYWGHIKRCFPPGSAFFYIADIAALFVVLGIYIYEIGARRRFDEEQGNAVIKVKKDEAVSLALVVFAIIFLTINPFGR